MVNTLNNISPDFRDFLLNRNIISDTIENNGLVSLLNGIGYPANIEGLTNSVIASDDIIGSGEFFKDLNVINNKFQGEDIDYRFVSIENIPGTNLPSSVLTNSSFYRNNNTLKNVFTGSDVESRLVSINFIPTNTSQIFNEGSYLDRNGELNIGGPSTEALNILGSLSEGGGIGFNPNSGNVVPDYDVRGSLSGRLLNATGLINDTQLGRDGVKYLSAALLNNVSFNLQEETIGNLNLNPISLLTGGDIIKPNYSITVARTGLGKAVDIFEKLSGFKRPVSIIDESASIFSFSNTTINNSDTETRNNSLIINTGKGQSVALFANLNSNLNEILNGGRKGYAPNYKDERISDKVINSSTYPTFPFTENINITGSYGVDGSLVDEYMWTDTNHNPNYVVDIPAIGIESDYDTKFNSEERSLLYKTRELFKGNSIRTLTSGKALTLQDKSETESNVIDRYISKGSGVLSEDYLEGNTVDPSEVFCRVWTTFDRYNQVLDLQKNSGLDPVFMHKEGDYSGISVLGENGFVRIGPYKGENIKKFMFSLENLAWVDNLQDLRECEIGDGDIITGNKGRIMWFPPYDLSFNETTSVNNTKNEFIGRGEPIYTYNNSERTGTLSWKIIIDHPNYMNHLDDFEKGNPELAQRKLNSIIAGCLKFKGFRENVLTKNQEEALSVKQNIQKITKIDNEEIPETSFEIFFANDVFTIPDRYENGLKNNSDNENEEIDYEETPNGLINSTTASNSNVKGYGLGTTKGSGIVGLETSTYNDHTNFSLNNQEIVVNGKTFKGWKSPALKTEINNFLKNKCKFCRINISGFASTQGGSSKNQKLSEARAKSVKDWILNESGFIPSDDLFGDERLKISSEGQGETGVGCPTQNATFTDKYECKVNRKTRISFVNDTTLKESVEPINNSTLSVNEENVSLNIPLSSIFTECNYFEKLEQTDKYVYNTLKEKLKHFHPAFHSITPEGFNSRLTFLNQCTRQGPTKNSSLNANNLAFGRAPVCILRLGDFYNTKIIIDNMTFDYENQWDLNPEGAGVQPMIVTVNMSFSFIGGSTLNGPLNKLQNAISFNYFANTEIYDPRANTLVLTAPITTNDDDLEDSENSDGITNTPNKIEKDQMVDVDPPVSQITSDNFDTESVNKSDKDKDRDIIRNLSLFGAHIEKFDDVLTLNIKINNDLTNKLSKTIDGDIVVNLESSSLNIGKIQINPNDETSLLLKGDSSSVIGNSSKSGSVSVTIKDKSNLNKIFSQGNKTEHLKIFWTTGSSSNISLDID